MVYSRNHMKPKNGLAPRPKFHIYLPLSKPITDFRALEKLKEQIWKQFPSFDPNAIKVTQFMFGVENPIVEHVAGGTKIDTFIRDLVRLPDVIEEGSRNATLSAFAGRVITRYGDTEQAHDEFLRAAERCSTPLPAEELATIWRSAQGFYRDKVVTTPGYQDPAEFDFDEKRGFTIEDMERLLALKHIKIRMNDITGRMEVFGLGKDVMPGEEKAALPGRIRSFLKEKKIALSAGDTEAYLAEILTRYHYNPVVNMLKKTEWDGQDRINELVSIMGITDERETTLVTKWLHQTVALAFNDPKKPYGADGVLVLQGPQGMGKTLLFRTLSMRPDWFGEGRSIDMGNKDSIIQTTGKWITELGELDSTLKKEQSSLKAFLTEPSDEFRVPYAKESIRRARRTSFCATVNPDEFLIDETGSRRFWVVRPVINLEALLALDEPWLRQMWTQVYNVLYLPNPQGFRLNREEMEALQVRNESYRKPLQGEIEILDQLNFDTPERHWTWMTATRLAQSINLRYLRAVQVGRVLAKLAKMDPRIQKKQVHHTAQFLLPPVRSFDVLPFDDDKPAVLSNNGGTDGRPKLTVVNSWHTGLLPEAVEMLS